MYRTSGHNERFRVGPAANRYLGLPRALSFHELPAATRRRVAASLASAGLPAPILSERVRAGVGPRAFVALAIAGGLFTAAAFFAHFGDAAGALAVQPAAFAGVYAAGIFAILAGAIGRMRLAREGRDLPFPPGVYLLPTDLVDARTSRLLVYPLSGLRELRVEAFASDAGCFSHAHVALSFDQGFAHVFRVASEGLAASAQRQIDGARELVEEVCGGGDLALVSSQDPFFELRMGDAFTSAEPTRARAPRVSAAALRLASPVGIAAIALSLLVGGLLVRWRNALSDDTLFARARDENGTVAYERYLAKGTRHAVEVRETRLPRAALSYAEDDGSVEAIKDFRLRYPGSRFDDEARRALALAYERELRMAKTWGSARELQSFLTRHPGSPIDAEARAALSHAEQRERDEAAQRGRSEK